MIDEKTTYLQQQPVMMAPPPQQQFYIPQQQQAAYMGLNMPAPLAAYQVTRRPSQYLALANLISPSLPIASMCDSNSAPTPMTCLCRVSAGAVGR